MEHDRAKNLLQYNPILKQLIEHTADVRITQSKIASIGFPLKLKEATQVDSKVSLAAQMADVLIGGGIEAGKVVAGLKKADYDPDKALSVYRDEQFIHRVPSLDIEGQNEFRKGGQGATVIDCFAKHFHKHCLNWQL